MEKVASSPLPNGWEFIVNGQSIKLTRNGAEMMIGELERVLSEAPEVATQELDKDPFDVAPEVPLPESTIVPGGPKSGLVEIDGVPDGGLNDDYMGNAEKALEEEIF
jgi:hypothetical protein